MLTTWKNGSKQGLTVAAIKSAIEIYIDKNDKTIFYMQFDATGRVIKRQDPLKQFPDVQPNFFIKVPEVAQ